MGTTRKKRKRQTTGRLQKAVEQEMKMARKTWMELGWLAQDRANCGDMLPPCAPEGSEELSKAITHT